MEKTVGGVEWCGLQHWRSKESQGSETKEGALVEEAEVWCGLQQSECGKEAFSQADQAGCELSRLRKVSLSVQRRGQPPKTGCLQGSI